MRACFALMERAAATDLTVLLEGETGTGKTAAAEAIHGASARSEGPFAAFDCSAIPANLLESELFGHEKGAFTGADARRVGVFEEADGGTIFLDEIGELSPELQPKLLRALDQKKIRRVGSNEMRTINVRVIAATNRDLRVEVNLERFRPDLYYRLAVVRIGLPPLRERLEDIPLLVEQLVRAAGAEGEHGKTLKEKSFIEGLQGSAWPGNVRELKNYIERCIFFQESEPPPTPEDPDLVDDGLTTLNEANRVPVHSPAVDLAQPYTEARRRALAEFERSYLLELLRVHGDKTTKAAAAAGINRIYLYKLLRKHRLK